jgi:hypothetical protein
MGEWNCCNQGGLGRDKGGGCRRRPEERLGRALQQVGERLQRLCHGWQETPVEIDEAQKSLQLFQIRGRREVLNGRDVAGQRDDARLGDHVTQELERGDSEHTLGRVDCEAVFLQHRKELGEMFQVFLHGGTGNEVVIQVCEHEGQMAKKSIH